jgi:dethiobiotin synthetase
VVAARAGLGTINHTLLTLGAARAVGLRVAGVVLTPWSSPGPLEESNRATIAALGEVEVATLSETTPAGLAAAGASLPLDAWIGSPMA